MSELRARIVDALREHVSDDYGYCRKCTRYGALVKGGNKHLADVLVSLPDIAIVELPEALHDNKSYQVWFTKCGNVLLSKDENQLIFREHPRTPKDLRTLAAALLAAANKAEEKHD